MTLIKGNGLIAVAALIVVTSVAARGYSSRAATRINPRDGASMVYIPAGRFTMGSRETELWMQPSSPPHTVSLDGYYIYKYLVTVKQYKKFCDATGHPMPPEPPWGWSEDDYPIVNVTWDDAAAYAAWAGASLPTEAQWEKAARGTDRRGYPWGSAWDAARCRNSTSPSKPEGPAAVGSFPGGASPYGVLDMAGNVWQWCADWYDERYYSRFPRNAALPQSGADLAKNPAGPAGGSLRVVRGGGWSEHIAEYFLCVCRGRNLPDVRMNDYGFRCVYRP